MFIPATRRELVKLGWDQLDVVLVTGDSYIDSPHMGIAVIGHELLSAGFKVGMVAQPDIESADDIARLGEPRLFWGVTGGSIDSMVANRTATGRKRKSDDYTPGGVNNRRPDRAVIAYSNLIRKHFKQTSPIVLGGIEASMRRVAHYDYWADRVRKSILFDAKADYLVYGMGEKAVCEIARGLARKKDIHRIPGMCYAAREKVDGYLDLPSFERVANDKQAFTRMFMRFYGNQDPLTAKGLCQQQDTRYLVHNPPAPYMTQKELDRVYDLDYERAVHPHYHKQGEVRAMDTIRFSIATHRGCYGECNFCSIGVHEGRTIRWRSEKSILKEARRFTKMHDFKGIISDVGGPTANMYGCDCERRLTRGSCPKKRCLYPKVCRQLKVDHSRQIKLLQKLRALNGVRKVFVGSGIRYDMILADSGSGEAYLREVVRHHVSGQMKVAPEHTEERVLERMGKPGTASLLRFRDMFNRLTHEAHKKQYLTYYFIAAHPGCSEKDMKTLKSFTSRELKIRPEQVQIFTPLPSTYAAAMYHTEKDPQTGAPVFVEKTLKGKDRQKKLLVNKLR